MQLRQRWPRGRGSSQRLLFCALLAGLLCAPAMAESYYEFNGPYCFGTGGACFGAPVDVVTGAFLIRQDLETIPGRVPIRMGWQFNSQDNTSGTLGKGTSLSYDYFISPAHVLGYSYDLSAPGNLHFAFDLTPNGNGDYIDSRDPELLGATLHFTGVPPSLSCTLRWKNGSKFTFDQYGQLIKVADRRGNYLTIGRDNSIPRTGFATTVYQQNILRRVIFAYTGGKLTTMQVKFERDPSTLNHTWTFGYDAQGRLSTVTDPMNGVTHYAWTSYVRSPDNVTLPLVDTVTNPRGYVEVHNEYDPLGSGRVVKQTYADGRILTAAYSNPILQNGTTTVTDPNANVTTWAHTWIQPGYLGYTIDSVTDTFGRQTLFQRNGPSSTLITDIYDYRNRHTQLGWDYARGNLTSVTRPTNSGGTATWSATYDPTFSQLASITAPPPAPGQPQAVTTFTVDPVKGDTTAVLDARNYTTSFGYDSANGDLLSVTNPLNQVTSYTHDADTGALKTVKDALNHQTVLAYDNMTRLKSIQDANLKTVQLGYDLMRRLKTIQQTLSGATLTTTLNYDANGNLQSLTDPRSKVWQWTYDPRDRVETEQSPLSTLPPIVYAWDGNSNLLTRTDRLGQVWDYHYGSGRRDRLEQVFFKRADQSVESSYTVNYRQITVGLVTYNTEMIDTVVDSVAGTFSYGYDTIDRMSSESGPAGSVVVAYDDLNRRKQLQVSSQGLVTYGYNLTNDIEAITQNGQSATFQYDPLGRMTKRTLPNAVSTEWGFNTAGLLTSVISKLNGTPFDSHTYVPDAVGNILQETINGAPANTFGYDDLYRLTSSSVGGVASSWVYDNNGNRTSQTVGGVVTSYTPDDANRLIAVNGVTVTNDANGNVTGDGTKAYSWDVRGRLVGMSGPGLSASFVPDYLGRRLSKTINGATTTFLNDGADVVTDTTGGTASQTLHGPAIDEPLARNGLFFTPNHLGSTTTLTDMGGVVQQSYSYSAFGEATGSGTVANPFQFTGRENDGTGLMYYRSRYFAPAWGRFISEDPMGLDGGINAYAYAANNPVNYVDHGGTSPTLVTGAVGAIGGALIGGGLAWWRGEDIWGGAGRGALIGGIAGLTGGAVGFWAASAIEPLGLSAGWGVLAGAGTGALTGGAEDAAGQGAEFLLGWRQCYDWAQTWSAVGIGAVTGGAGAWYQTGWEPRVGNWRVAPFGNRRWRGMENPWYREAPHYHRRGAIDPATGRPRDGQGVGRHRPWQPHAQDRSFWDRF